MPKIALSLARPGQKLARAVTSPSGVVMMQAGTELTAASIERLAALGIDAVVVAVGVAETREGPSLEERRLEVETRFAGHEHDAWMMELKAIVLRQLSSQAPEPRDA